MSVTPSPAPATKPVALSHDFPPGMALRFTLAYATLFLPFGIATPYLQTYLKYLGQSQQEIGITLGMLDAVGVAAMLIWGWVSDHGGRRRTMLLWCTLGSIPTFMLFQWANTLPLTVFVALAFGLFFRPLIPLTDGLTFRYLHLHGGNYGLARSGGSIAFVVAALSLGVLGIDQLAGHESFLARYFLRLLGFAPETPAAALIPWCMAVVLMIQALNLRVLPRDEPAPPRREPRPTSPAEGAASETKVAESSPYLRLILSRPFVLFCLAAFLGRVAMMSYYGFFTNYINASFPGHAAGYLWAIGPLSEIPVIYYSQRFMSRIGPRNLFALGLLGIMVRLIGNSLVTEYWMFLPLQLLHALTFGAYHSASVTYVSRLVPPDMQSRATTLFAAVSGGLGGLCGGALGGWVLEHTGTNYDKLYLAFSGLAALGLAVLLFGVPRDVLQRRTA